MNIFILAGEFFRMDPARLAYAEVIANLLLAWIVLSSWLLGHGLGTAIHRDLANRRSSQKRQARTSEWT